MRPIPAKSTDVVTRILRMFEARNMKGVEVFDAVALMMASSGTEIDALIARAEELKAHLGLQEEAAT